MNFDVAFERLLQHEGGYSNHRADPGGETMYGITEAVARKHSYLGPMHDLSLDTARAIYRRDYWDAVQADLMPDAVRFDLFDAAVNSGVRSAVRWLQRAAHATDDGIIGPKTLLAVRLADPHKLAKRFNGHRLKFMVGLGAWSSFGRGWARRIATNLIDG